MARRLHILVQYSVGRGNSLIVLALHERMVIRDQRDNTHPAPPHLHIPPIPSIVLRTCWLRFLCQIAYCLHHLLSSIASTILHHIWVKQLLGRVHRDALALT